MKFGRYAIAVILLLLLARGVQAYTWSDIDLEGTFGTGDNSALLVVDFSSGNDDSFAWQVNFSTEKVSLYEMLTVIDSNDATFSFSMKTNNEGPIDSITYGASTASPGYWGGKRSNDLGENWFGGGIAQARFLFNDEDAFGLNAGSFVPAETPTVPVPAAVWMMGSGLLGLVGVRRKTASS